MEPSVAAGFHGVIEGVSLLHGPDKEHGCQQPPGAEGSAKIPVAKPGVLGAEHGGGLLQQKEEEPVHEQHQLRQDPGEPAGPQNTQDVRHGRGQGEKVEAGYRGHGCEDEAAAAKKALPAAGQPQGPRGRAKASRGVRERLTRTAAVPRSTKASGMRRSRR